MSTPEIDDGGPAFPHSAKPMAGEATEWGMTLRDWFAGMALQGILANPGGPIQANGMSGWGWTNCDQKSVVEVSFGIADAMLAVRKGVQP